MKKQTKKKIVKAWAVITKNEHAFFRAYSKNSIAIRQGKNFNYMGIDSKVVPCEITYKI